MNISFLLHFILQFGRLFLYRTAQQLSQENPGESLLVNLHDFKSHFRERALPVTRVEFESRALLFQLLVDLERFIQLKVDFYGLYHI